MDGHVHITNRVYWEGIDPWQPQDTGWDYARARLAGVNVIIEDIAPYGYGNFNYTPKQTLRLIETFHRFAERNADKMAIALTSADARKIAASGRLATFMGIDPASIMKAIPTCSGDLSPWATGRAIFDPDELQCLRRQRGRRPTDVAWYQ